jgi:hypothetical protein
MGGQLMQLIELCLMSLGCGTSLDYSDAIAFLAGVVAHEAHKNACLKSCFQSLPYDRGGIEPGQKIDGCFAG